MFMTVRSGQLSRSGQRHKETLKISGAKRTLSSASSLLARRTPTATERIRTAIQKIPRGYVSTYGAIGRAAGYPRGARQVASLLHRSLGLPWHRVLGSGGEIKLQGEHALEQKFRLQAEGVGFRGRRVDMARYEFKFRKK
jgi:methylated-DNA-protein-cysteine methyltransferase-like protein